MKIGNLYLLKVWAQSYSSVDAWKIFCKPRELNVCMGEWGEAVELRKEEEVEERGTFYPRWICRNQDGWIIQLQLIFHVGPLCSENPLLGYPQGKRWLQKP
ncbi:hypothetical protein KIL84_020577 [Mauremys mutica]|uniref:Uncharacterized protein n=1 Tax=Mauremys mutica TaxID=74926 RepID=A0A9D4BB41_9SAUR|nr:hypothetical protein KIL84_020577 [Mauremys mutica]